MKAKIFAPIIRVLVSCLIVALIIFTGCSKESEDIDNPIPKLDLPKVEDSKIPINIATGLWTKATDSGFESGDKIGLYVVNYSGSSPGVLSNSGNHVSNMRFTLSSSWTPDSPIYWKDGTTKTDFYCYYPHNSPITDITSYPFNLKANQSTTANYKSSDFLWGKTSGLLPSSNAILITVNHVMSNLIIKLTPGTGYTESELTSATITIKNLKSNSTVNLSTGVATAIGTTGDIIPLKETGFYRALVVPQSITDLDLIQVELGTDTFTLKKTITFVPNKQHTCTLIIGKTSDGVNITIGGWDNDGIDHGGTLN